MSESTVTRADLSEAVYQEVGLSRNENVKISSFGSFLVRQKSGRMGRNPKTGEEVPIGPRRVLVFRPSQVLKSIVAGNK